MQQFTQTIKIGEIDVVIKQWTLGDVRNWLETLQQRDLADLVGVALLEKISIAEIKELTNLTDEQLNSLPVSEIEKIETKCEELNKRFFVLRGKIYGEVKLSLTTPTSYAASSKETSPSSLEPDITTPGTTPGPST